MLFDCVFVVFVCACFLFSYICALFEVRVCLCGFLGLVLCHDGRMWLLVVLLLFCCLDCVCSFVWDVLLLYVLFLL